MVCLHEYCSANHDSGILVLRQLGLILVVSKELRSIFLLLLRRRIFFIMVSTPALMGIYALLNTLEAKPHKLQTRDCSITWPAYESDNCASFADLWSISEAQFLSYNPGAVCSALKFGKEYCVEWSGTSPALPTQATPTPVVTPTPTLASTTFSTARTTLAAIATCPSTPAGVVTPSPIQVCSLYLHYLAQRLNQGRQE
jgi:hypothetical protein